MSEQRYAAVLTHLPDTGETFYTPFEGDHAGMRAHAFRDSEEERGDFPGSLWTVVMTDEASDERRDDLLKAMGIRS